MDGIGGPQFTLLEAAVKADVKRFVPSCFGVDWRNPINSDFLLVQVIRSEQE